ncbi:hypothetical protein VWN77_10485, partial [Campylobacter coli]
NLKLYEWLMSEKFKDLDEIRKCLGRMLFSGSDQEKMAASLSGLEPDKSVNLQNHQKRNYQLGLFADLEELASANRFKFESEFNA